MDIAECEHDYVINDDCWEPSLQLDLGELPKGLKEIIDDDWESEKHQTFGSRRKSTEIQHTRKACDMSVLEEIESNLSLKFSSMDASVDENDNDDYESCESDNDLEESIPVSKKEFQAAFCQASMLWSRNIQEKGKKLSSVLKLFGAQQSTHITADCMSVSLPSKRLEKHSDRPKDLKRSYCDGVSSTSALPSPYKRCSIRYPEKSTSRIRLSLFGSDRNNCNGNSSKITLSSSILSSRRLLSENHPARISERSRCDASLSTTNVKLSEDRNNCDGNSSKMTLSSSILSSKRLFSENHLASTSERSRCDAILSTTNVKLSEKSVTLKESSFSDYLNRLKINSPLNKDKGIKDEAWKQRQIRISSASLRNSRDEEDVMTPPSKSPVDQNKKRSIFKSPHKNRFSEFGLENRDSKEREVSAPILRTHQADAVMTLPSLSSIDQKKKQSIFESPRKKRLSEFGIENRESKEREVPAPILRTYQRDNLSNFSGLDRSATMASASSTDGAKLSRPPLSISKSSGRTITLDSSTLKKGYSSQRKSIRSLTKGRSIFTI